MTNHCKFLVTIALCGIVGPAGRAQAPQFATLEIEWENYVAYVNDLADPSKIGTSPTMVNPNLRNFMTAVLMGDIVSVNGRPAKGSFVVRGQFIMLGPNPLPGQAIGDIGRAAVGDYLLEILQPDGTPVGSIMTAGFGSGSAPPGAPPGVFLNTTVTGGTGAFLGARGMLTSSPFTLRAASMAEDPATRRTFGGGKGRFLVYLIPLARPEIASVFHTDFSPVTSAHPARVGEALILSATGLGPTRPGISPGTPFPDNPLQQVNSPVEVAINGKPAEVVNKIGWPGTTGTYRVDILVPEGTGPGPAALQITAAYVTGPALNIPIQ
jgi:uncharacterized protein (TIGR03437 family)